MCCRLQYCLWCCKNNTAVRIYSECCLGLLFLAVLITSPPPWLGGASTARTHPPLATSPHRQEPQDSCARPSPCWRPLVERLGITGTPVSQLLQRFAWTISGQKQGLYLGSCFLVDVGPCYRVTPLPPPMCSINAHGRVYYGEFAILVISTCHTLLKQLQLCRLA